MRVPRSLLFISLASLAFSDLCAQLPSAADKIKERYQKRVDAADALHDAEISKISGVYEKAIDLARQEAKKAFEPLIRAAAMRNQTEEVRTLTLQMESIINPGDPKTESGNTVSNTLTSEYRELVGTWLTQTSSPNATRYKFDIKPNKKWVYTYDAVTYPSRTTTTFSYNGRIAEKPGKLVLTLENGPQYSTPTERWWEIAIPFNPEMLEVVLFHKSEKRESESTYFLKKEK